MMESGHDVFEWCTGDCAPFTCMKKAFGNKILSFVALLCTMTSVRQIHAQALLNADGPGNTYELINSVLAPGYDVVEHPECVHPEFGRHIAEVWDDALGKYVFEFYIHVTPDNDRCINFDRQRMEIKTYDASPANLKGVTGETVVYKWKFKLPSGYQPSPNFTHIHQVKAVGGNDDDPIITLTVRKGSPNKIELIHNNTTKVAIVNQSLFAGEWVECTEVIYLDSLHGTYSISIKKVSDGTTVLSYSSNDIMTIRSDNTFIRPKWGIYRSLLSSSDLRDDTIRFNGFFVAEGSTSPAAPSTLTASVTSGTTINLGWIDNSSNEESFAIERSANGSVWSALATVDPNSTGYTDTVLDTAVPYFYRVRAENTFGNSAYATSSGTVSGTIFSAASGNWSSPSTWIGGSIPSGTDHVEINADDTVTIDVNTGACNNLAVNGKLTFPNVDARAITVNGNLSIGATGDFNTYQTGNPTGVLTHTITLKGNLSVASGGKFDMRKGSSGNVSVGTVLFTGSTNDTIALSQSTYSSSVEEFNSVTINKSGGAKVVLSAGNLFMSNNNSTGPSVLTLTNGIIETGNNAWIHLSTASGGVLNGSSSSYINGALGRGGNTSGGTNRTFEVGDANGYRPVIVSTNAGIASGGYVIVHCIAGDANNSSTFTGGIDKVSAVRYYNVMFKQGTGSTIGTGISKTALSYAAGDGVTDGNTDLRVAYSTDNRVMWNGVSQSSTHTTTVTTTPTTITPDNFSSALSLIDGASIFVSLANATGGGNPLPVEVSHFSASTDHKYATLIWKTAVETNSVGFDIERLIPTQTPAGKGDRNDSWEKIGFVKSHGTSNVPREYRFIDRNFPRGVVQYRLKIIDNDGAWKYSSEVSVDIGFAPRMLTLADNYPNPFNPTTAIEFTVPIRGKAVLSVFNPLGQKVADVFNGEAEAGMIHYAIFDAQHFSSGIYAYRLEFGGNSITKKMLLIK